MGAKWAIIAALVLSVVAGSMWIGARMSTAGAISAALDAVSQAMENRNEVDAFDRDMLRDALTRGVH